MSGRRQFDFDETLDRAMKAFWTHGYSEATLEVLGTATGLGRGSLYGAFGDKDALFRRALERYSSTYGARYEQALASHPDDPVAAVRAFFQVVLDRIADPDVPIGCLMAQSATQSPTLSADSRALVQQLLAVQHERVLRALSPDGDPSPELDELASFVVAVNQSLAVMSRAGAPMTELQAIVRIACDTVAAELDSAAAAQSIS
ncbi:TetR/AcrR family transcriptional regulator [Mycolicibacterium sp.]|uniref:TetR/AcrR family transcriptional regulator n=1 Tax=Mycolicibacterium sp. TaxID=2320850 RepID=UPI003D0AB763